MTSANGFSKIVSRTLGVALACLLCVCYYLSILSPKLGALAGLITAFLGFLGLFSSKTPIGHPLKAFLSDRTLGQIHIVVSQGAKSIILVLVIFLSIVLLVYLDFYLTTYLLITVIFANFFLGLVVFALSIDKGDFFSIEIFKRAYMFLFLGCLSLSLVYFSHTTKVMDHMYVEVKSSSSYDVSISGTKDRKSHIHYWLSVYTINLYLDKKLSKGCRNENFQSCNEVLGFLSKGNASGLEKDFINGVHLFKEIAGHDISNAHMVRWQRKFESALENPKDWSIFHKVPVAIMWAGKEYFALLASSAKIMAMYLFLKLNNISIFGSFFSFSMLLLPIPLSKSIKGYNMKYDDEWDSDGHLFLLIMGLFGFLLATYSFISINI